MCLISVNSKFNFATNLGRPSGKYLMEIIFDIKIEVGIFEISNEPILSVFNFGTNLGLTCGKYFIKIIFDII